MSGSIGLRYTDAIERDDESIGRWCRRYFGIGRCKPHSLFRFYRRHAPREVPRAIEECFPDRRASAGWRIGCATSRSKSPLIYGRSSRRGSPPAIRRRRRRSPDNWRRASAPITPISCERAGLFRGRFRGVFHAPAVAGHPLPFRSNAVRRVAPAAEDRSQRLRREACAQAHVRRAHPSRQALARPAPPS